ncbi:FMN reductase [Actinokineospora spheciospongiae]|uniref:FMN reductase n=1 Tax=Actinokineospora spheciospongiae TaxID=909613 RepID=W7J4F1_9PSEU|nr:NADPH-dependent FMN reductase [Actinokineospora spheciospongiae]EWC63851.1 FMN reductase [Actinokineospora spheciospongiae]
MGTIVLVSGSPSATARPGIVVTHTETALRAAGHTVTTVRVRDLPTVALLAEDHRDPRIGAALAAVQAADGLVVISPVYRAAYSGLVKSLLDLLPSGALAGTAVLPLATGGTQGHLVALDFVLRPLLFAMGATRVLPGHFVPDRMITPEDEGGVETGTILPLAAAALTDVLISFTDSLRRPRTTHTTATLTG